MPGNDIHFMWMTHRLDLDDRLSILDSMPP